MNKQFLKDSLGWEFVLWLVGYVLGIILFFVLPTSLIGWVITPIGVIITFWVLSKKVQSGALQLSRRIEDAKSAIIKIEV